jgi:hypothetical protein
MPALDPRSNKPPPTRPHKPAAGWQQPSPGALTSSGRADTSAAKKDWQQQAYPHHAPPAALPAHRGGGNAVAAAGGAAAAQLTSQLMWRSRPSDPQSDHDGYGDDGGAGAGAAYAPASPGAMSRQLQWSVGAGSSGGGGGYQQQYQQQQYQQQQYQQQQSYHHQQHHHYHAGSAAALASAATAADEHPSTPTRRAAGHAPGSGGGAPGGSYSAAFAVRTPSTAIGLPASDHRARVAITPSGYPAGAPPPAQLPPGPGAYWEPQGAAVSPAGSSYSPLATTWTASSGALSSGGPRVRGTGAAAGAPLQWSLPDDPPASPGARAGGRFAYAPRAAAAAAGRRSDGSSAQEEVYSGASYSSGDDYHLAQPSLQPHGLQWGLGQGPHAAQQWGAQLSPAKRASNGGGGDWGDHAAAAATLSARPPSQQRLEGLGRLKQLSTARLVSRVTTPPLQDSAHALLSDDAGGFSSPVSARSPHAPLHSKAGSPKAATHSAARRSSGEASGLGGRLQADRRDKLSSGDGGVQARKQGGAGRKAPAADDEQAAAPARRAAPAPAAEALPAGWEDKLGPEAFQSEAAGGGDDRVECCTCGRRFAPAALERHNRICAKVFCSKRPAFDASEKRGVAAEAAEAAGSGGGGFGKGGGRRRGAAAAAPKGGAAVARKAGGHEESPAVSAKAAAKAKWLKQSEQLRAAMRAAKGGGGGGGSGEAEEEPEDDR